MLKKFFLLSVTAFVLFTGYDADGFTLKRGTVSISGESTISAMNSDPDQSDSSNLFGASAAMGYFFRDNFELGGKLSGSYIDRDGGDAKGFSISPYLTYHFDLNKKSNIYLTGSVGISRSYSDHDFYSTEEEGTIWSSEIGWEYFFNPSISGTIGLRYEKTDMDRGVKNTDYDSDYSYDSTRFGTVLGFKIYF